MLETGLRVGDAVRFDPRIVDQGRLALDLHFRSAKRKRTENLGCSRISGDDIKTRIDECDWLSKRGPFWYREEPIRRPSCPGRLRMNAVYRCSGRDRGLPAAPAPRYLRREKAACGDAARGRFAALLGHSSVKVTEAYYCAVGGVPEASPGAVFAESLGRGWTPSLADAWPMTVYK